MEKNMYDFPTRLKSLRNKMGYTQSELARKLSITRAGVNAWEMGLSAPSTPVIVELSKLFNVTCDYLLGLEDGIVIRTDNLREQEISVILNLLTIFKENRTNEFL